MDVHAGDGGRKEALKRLTDQLGPYPDASVGDGSVEDFIVLLYDYYLDEEPSRDVFRSDS
jgi:hypothetical protein